MTDVMNRCDTVIGIDPSAHSVAAAAISARTEARLGTTRTGTTTADLAGLTDWANGFSTPATRVWSIEGSNSWGRCVLFFLTEHGEHVVEYDPDTLSAKDGSKTDELDALRAARGAIARGVKNHQPRAHTGPREALRVCLIARSSAVEHRKIALTQLRSLISTAAPQLREHLANKTQGELLNACAQLDPDTDTGDLAQQHTHKALRALAERIGILTTEITGHDRDLETLCETACPQLLERRGIGPYTAAIAYLAWSHHGRFPNHHTFARLAGVAPIPVHSGTNQTLHRLNRHGDRQLNSALYIIAINRLRTDPTTRAYTQTKIAQGKTKKAAIRCLKWYISREIFKLLEHPPQTP